MSTKQVRLRRPRPDITRPCPGASRLVVLGDICSTYYVLRLNKYRSISIDTLKL